jgi:hypothetical protein
MGTDGVITLPESGIPGNVAVGGDFSGNAYAWHVLSGSDATLAVMGTEGCLTLHAVQGGGIGWPSTGSLSPPSPQPANLAAGSTYTLAYTARVLTPAQTTVSIDAKVGLSMSPYTPDFESSDMVGPTATSFSHPFAEMTPGDTSAGISLNFAGATGTVVCFSNVTLTPN